MSNSTIPAYDEFHRRILQGISAVGFIDENGIKTLIQGVQKLMRLKRTEKENIHIDEVIEKINRTLEPSGSTIGSAFSGLSKQRFYYFSLFNLKPPIIPRRPHVGDFLVKVWKRIIHDVMRKYETFSISIEKCINITFELGEVDNPEKCTTDFIKLMLHFNYFEKYFPEENASDSYEVTLGTRALVEFEDVLQKEYGDVLKSCKHCHQQMLNGLKCPVKECTSSIHKACLQRFLAQTGTGNCPSEGCKGNWKEAKLENCKNSTPNQGPEGSSSANLTEDSVYFNNMFRFSKNGKAYKCPEPTASSSSTPTAQSPQPCKCFSIVPPSNSDSGTVTTASTEQEEYLRVPFTRSISPIRHKHHYGKRSQKIQSEIKSKKQIANKKPPKI